MDLPVEKFIFIGVCKKETKLQDSDKYDCLSCKAEHRKEKKYKNHSSREDNNKFCELIPHRFVFWIKEAGNNK
ncbi:hypothetical protein [Lacihabitans sp. CCS-44]|uniref:hypothetical protein n=1 Tax=Lacihabitans sp. CCS-44 TaxID=2487331 RepID=UPI0020CDED1A|nr:hypothetical protein [Lacihabitans sp. CCS-44]